MGIAQSSVLVDLNISMWSGRKRDKKVSAEVDAAKNTRTKAGNYHKNLFAGSNTLEQLVSVAGRIRSWHETHTLPWNDRGARLLKMDAFFEYKKQANDLESEFNAAVQTFLDDYPTVVSAAAFQLGDMFDRSEYPSVQDLRDRFSIRWSFSPVPLAGDFRIDADAETQKILKEQYEKMYEEKTAAALKSVWDRLHGYLTHMSERLAEDVSDGTKKRIHGNSMVENGLELCAVLSQLNVTNDPKLVVARKDLERALVGVDGKDLKRDGIREDVKAQMDEMLKKFAW